MNLPTDALHKFISALGVLMIAAAAAQILLTNDKWETAHASASAAKAEYVELLKQSEEATRRANELYKSSATDFEASIKLMKAGKLNEGVGVKAGADSLLKMADEYLNQSRELSSAAQKKQVESSRLSAIADVVSTNADKQTKLLLAVSAMGSILFCWGVYAWARAKKSEGLPIPPAPTANEAQPGVAGDAPPVGGAPLN